MFELVFLNGPRAGETVKVTRTLLAGRSPDCSLEVPDPNASRRHTNLVYDGGTLTVSDNGSSNGTYINEARLTGPMVMHHGDVLRLGETKIRIQQSASQTTGASIFQLQDQDPDLSGSIIMPLSEAPRQASIEVLSARLAAIMRVSQALTNIRDREAVFRSILDALFEVFPQADRGFLLEGATATTLKPAAYRVRGTDNGEAPSISMTICGKALDARSAFLFNAQDASGFDQGMSIVSLRIRSAMTIPLLVDTHVMGLLQIDTADPKRAFTQEDLELAVTTSRLAAAALHNADLLAKVETETRMRDNLLRFLPRPLAEQALTGNLNLDLGGTMCHGTILFSDVIGFTRLSERLAPSEVIRLMNDYFAAMVPCIEREGGWVDKFIGDAVMAIWGIPFDRGDAATGAAQSALSMQNALAGFNSVQRALGRVELHMGLGLNTGPVVAGNIGFGQEIEYTLLGDVVNTAARVQHAAIRSQVLIRDATYAALKGGAFGVAMPPLMARNKSEPIRTYCLRGCANGQEVLLHIPVKINGVAGLLVRRLADQSFILLHELESDPTTTPIVGELPELPALVLGTAVMVQSLPANTGDGRYARSQVRLADPTLSGLLSNPPLPSAVGWDALIR